MKTLLKSIALAATVAGLAGTAQAVPTLYLSTDGATWTNVATDNGAGDVNGLSGQVTFIGAFAGISFHVDTGTTYPVIGSLTNPSMDLAFNVTFSGAGGTVYMAFSADGFGPTSGTVGAAIGGTAPGGSTVSYNTYGGNSNVLNDQSTLLSSQGPFVGVAFSGSTTGGSVNNAGPYSLTQVVRVTGSAGQIVTGDAFLHVPDSGASVLLLGAGLIGVGVIARLRRRIA